MILEERYSLVPGPFAWLGIRAAGSGSSTPAFREGLFDTGTTRSAVSLRLVSDLGLKPCGSDEVEIVAWVPMRHMGTFVQSSGTGPVQESADGSKPAASRCGHRCPSR